MPSEKAKENKALVAVCAACQKSSSTEVMVSLSGRDAGRPRIYPVCLTCADNGWRPPGFTGVYRSRPT
jgi:hypothetical protein